MIAAIRVRGTVNIKGDNEDNMKLLRLNRPNHMVLVKDDKQSRKMIEKAKDYITFGEVNEETLGKLLEKRGRLTGDKKLTKEFLKEQKSAGFTELAKEIITGKKSLKELGIKPVFRLHPPRKGHGREGTKKAFSVGGALGYRADKINDLIVSMM